MDLDRYNSYNKNHCWQYDIRLQNFKRDLEEAGLTEEDAAKLKVSDFRFEIVEDLKIRSEMKKFIERHEWLGTLSQFTTHWFACFYKDQLAGVILFNMPNAFSKIVGEKTKKMERLISRGACISWSPKNLASSFVMWCINYMVQNTRYRVFSAYSDPTAKELGTIYQACNFYYMGKNAGTTKRYINPYTGRLVSDRFFRTRSAYKKYAKDLGIAWGSDWNNDQKMLWDNVPDTIEKQLRDYGKKQQQSSNFHTFPKKHKYIYILGRDKRETKALKKEFLERNKVFDYPKER